MRQLFQLRGVAGKGGVNPGIMGVPDNGNDDNQQSDGDERDYEVQPGPSRRDRFVRVKGKARLFRVWNRGGDGQKRRGNLQPLTAALTEDDRAGLVVWDGARR
jgi:hypothetical protein